MKITVDSKKEIREWPRVEKYQNTTLRYTPDASFCPIMEKTIGRCKIIRLFVTLDEVWDYRSDTYDWDYKIGVNKYVDDPNHYHYDWPLSEPSPFHVGEIEYLTSHANCSDQVLLNIRRYEQEVMKGIVTIDKYKEVLKNVLAFYKDLCPNITYIELCNEVELVNFGNLNMKQYYKLYKSGYEVVSQLNAEKNYEIPLQVGGFGLAFGVSHFDIWYDFLKLLAQDQNRIIDFYSFHEYHMDTQRIMEFYVRHHQTIKQLGLPDLPLLMSEYGMRTGVGDAGRPHNLQNAAGEIPGMILGSYCEGLAMFPWCTFHNPNQQLGRTMFVQDEKGDFIPTPSAHTMTMFSWLKEKEVWIEEYTRNCCVATKSESEFAILMTNVSSEKELYELHIKNLDESTFIVKQYLVDHDHNNYLTNHKWKKLVPTKVVEVIGNEVYEAVELHTYAFCFYEIKRKETY